MKSSNFPSNNKEIDILKLFFSFSIFMYHSRKLVIEGWITYNKGWLGTEFFFMVSGYFMAKKVFSDSKDCINRSTIKYVFAKIKRIFPVYFFAFLIAYFVRSFFCLHLSFGDFCRNFLLALPEASFLMLFCIPFGKLYNGPTWYISAMLIAMCLIYPLVKRHFHYYSTIGGILVAFFCYAILANNYGGLNTATDWMQIVGSGLIRAVAGISLGVVLFGYATSYKGKNIALSPIGKKLAFILQLFYFALIFAYFEFSHKLKMKSGFQYLIVLVIFALLYIVFSEMTGINVKLKKANTEWMSKLSLYLYLNHRCIIYLLQEIGNGWSYKKYMYFYIILTITCMTTCWLLVKIWERLKPFIVNSIKEFLFVR